MKKIIAVILSLCLLCGTVALAEITAHNGTSSTTVTYTIQNNEAFTVTIPASLNLSMEYGKPAGDLKISLSAPNFNVAGKTISVALTAANFKLINGDSEIAYTIKDKNAGTEISLNNTVLSWTSGGASTTADSTLRIEGATAGTTAGTYQDKLTFTASVGNVSVNDWGDGGSLGGGEAEEG